MFRLIFKQNLRKFKISKSSISSFPQILSFKEIKQHHFDQIGMKNELLSKIYNFKGIVKTPNGFCLTHRACQEIIYESELPSQNSNIKEFVNSFKNKEQLKLGITNKLLNFNFSKYMQYEIERCFQQLKREYGDHCSVGIRSNVSEHFDFENFYNIKSVEEIVKYCKLKLSEIYYNIVLLTQESDFVSEDVLKELSLTIQQTVHSNEITPSGIMYNVDYQTGYKNVIEISANYGMCEEFLDYDHFVCFKPNLLNDKYPIIEKSKGIKQICSVLDPHNHTIHQTKNTHSIIHNFCLTDSEIIHLSNQMFLIEKICSNGSEIKVKWSKDSISKEFYIIDVKKLVNVPRLANEQWIEEFVLKSVPKKVLAHGNTINHRITSGIVSNIRNVNQFTHSDQIIVTHTTNNKWNQIIGKSKGLIIEVGEKFHHAPLITKELGIPCIFKTKNATSLIHNGKEITMDGNTGNIYEGKLDFKVIQHDLFLIPQTKTKIMMTLDFPEEAFKYSFVPNSGVGLLRIESILKSIGFHPMAFLKSHILPKSEHSKLHKLTQDYPENKEYFIEKLSMSIGMICAAFYPKPVIMRFSDFNSLEFSQLIGGDRFELKEENPILGMRGVSRYLSHEYKEGFRLECEAVKRVRERMGFDNLQLILPMCRTVDNGKKILNVLKENGLEKSESLKIYLLCELPVHIFEIDQFLEIFDGYSIGTNDLTKTIMGVDKTNEIVSNIYHEKNSVIKNIISSIIEKVLNKKKYIGICGDATNLYPDFAEFLVECEIESISLCPSSIFNTIKQIDEKEKLISRILSRNPEGNFSIFLHFLAMTSG
jgi:pyruvate, water dikinase